MGCRVRLALAIGRQVRPTLVMGSRVWLLLTDGPLGLAAAADYGAAEFGPRCWRCFCRVELQLLGAKELPTLAAKDRAADLI